MINNINTNSNNIIEDFAKTFGSTFSTQPLNRVCSPTPSKYSSISFNKAILNDDNELILIDIREYEEYNQYHIKGAYSFSATNLNKDKVHPLIFKAKNQEGKIIVIYSTNDKSGIEYAQMFALRNYYNVYLLTGGIMEFVKYFPQLFEGNIPIVKTVNNTPKKCLGSK